MSTGGSCEARTTVGGIPADIDWSFTTGVRVLMGGCGGTEEEIGVAGDGDTCVISTGLSIGDDDG